MKIEYYKYTDRKCDECNGTVVYDEHRDEYYCLDCGLIQIGEKANENNKN